MRFGFTAEQQEFRQVLRRYFQETSPTSHVRRMMATETGWERDDWLRLNRELGLGGVHAPEQYGGQGFGLVELGIVLEEMGRALVPSPYFASAVLATSAILNAATEAQKEALLPPIIAGESVATLAFAEEDGRWNASGVATTASPAGARYRLDGVKSFVLDGATSDLVIVIARRPGSAGEEGLSFFAARGDAAGLTRQPLKSLDMTRKLARLEFAGVEADLIGEPDVAAAPFAQTLTQGAIALASEMVGGADRLREASLDYVKMRLQFGRPIASFQSMKHKQADMLLDVELAKSAAYYAAAAADEGDEGVAALASLAKAAASEAYLQTAIHAIQSQGGMGFTWDNDTHLWFRRAKSSEVFLGDPTWHREQLIQAWAA
jgi:alkylation response protein AidB-like acyl-CoA dehydrogenase